MEPRDVIQILKAFLHGSHDAALMLADACRDAGEEGMAGEVQGGLLVFRPADAGGRKVAVGVDFDGEGLSVLTERGGGLGVSLFVDLANHAAPVTDVFGSGDTDLPARAVHFPDGRVDVVLNRDLTLRTENHPDGIHSDWDWVLSEPD